MFYTFLKNHVVHNFVDHKLVNHKKNWYICTYTNEKRYEEVIYITSKSVLETHQLGSKSNISRLKKTLEEKEIIETEGELVTLADPVFTIWFKKEYMWEILLQKFEIVEEELEKVAETWRRFYISRRRISILRRRKDFLRRRNYSHDLFKKVRKQPSQVSPVDN